MALVSRIEKYPWGYLQASMDFIYLLSYLRRGGLTSKLQGILIPQLYIKRLGAFRLPRVLLSYIRFIAIPQLSYYFGTAWHIWKGPLVQGITEECAPENKHKSG